MEGKNFSVTDILQHICLGSSLLLRRNVLFKSGRLGVDGDLGFAPPFTLLCPVPFVLLWKCKLA